MVIDLVGIMEILRSPKEEILEHSKLGEDSILITSKYDDFNEKEQIGNDSIDLRIDNKGYILKDSYAYINTLSDENYSKYYKEVTLDLERGYDLKPGAVLFIGTVERIHLVGDLIGRVTGRSVFSRFGLSVHCTQDKFSSGINSIAALQIKNNSNTVLKIFPYQKLAQLIIEKTSHNQTPYTGSFSLEDEYKLPSIKPSDRSQYSDTTKANILKLKPEEKSMFQRKNKSEKFYSLLQSVMGISIALATAYGGSIEDDNSRFIFLVVMYIIYAICSICFYFMAGERTNENSGN